MPSCEQWLGSVGSGSDAVAGRACDTGSKEGKGGEFHFVGVIAGGRNRLEEGCVGEDGWN